jgi:hypothetical protein
MKIEFTPKRVKLARVAIALVAISLAGYVAYAASQISVSNSITVTVGAKNIFQDIIAPTGTCPGFGSIHYSDGTTNSTISAFSGSLPPTGTQTLLFCIENTNNSPVTVTFAQGPVTPSPSPGTIIITGGSLSVPASSFASSSQTLTVSPGVPPTTSTPYTFTITIS